MTWTVFPKAWSFYLMLSLFFTLSSEHSDGERGLRPTARVTLGSYFTCLSLRFLICSVMELIRSPTSQDFCKDKIK